MKRVAYMRTPGAETHGSDFHLIDEVVSAIQKEVRRGKPEMIPQTLSALQQGVSYWTMIYDRAGFGNAVFNRLFIIASEDIGLGSLCLPGALLQAYQKWQQHCPKKTSLSACDVQARTLLTNLCIGIARQPKSRLVNQIGVMATKSFVDNHRSEPLIRICASAPPLQAQCTAAIQGLRDERSRLLLRHITCCIEQKMLFPAAVCLNRIYMANYPTKAKEQLVNHYYLTDPVVMRAFGLFATLAQSSLKPSISALKEFYVRKPNRLYLMHAMLLAMLPLPKINLPTVPAKAMGYTQLITNVPTQLVSQLYMDATTYIETPLYARDKHTVRGKAQLRKTGGSQIEHFRDVGAHYENLADIVDEYTPRAWEWYVQLEKQLVLEGKNPKVKGAALLKAVLCREDKSDYDVELLRFYTESDKHLATNRTQKRCSDDDFVEATPGKKGKVDVAAFFFADEPVLSSRKA
eukprot:TRINITY_DN1150_c0_g2_i1.p1 TRINITY_DN1150_c0_g2~~TRINITY_DN1150_c0_g2_i1.p1  ORF type:complete len:472 (-),score=82.59 TRINITY_DN1150_c0_g2_i1:194-1579(-)